MGSAEFATDALKEGGDLVKDTADGTATAAAKVTESRGGDAGAAFVDSTSTPLAPRRRAAARSGDVAVVVARVEGHDLRR